METTKEERRELWRLYKWVNWLDGGMRTSYVRTMETPMLLKLLNDADRLAAIEPDYQNALGMIRLRGVPEQRAEHLAHALDVLLTRLDREIQSHRVVESAIERQVLWRTEDMPEGVAAWERDKEGTCIFWMRLECGVIPWATAPDYRPDEEGPIWLPILDPEEK